MNREVRGTFFGMQNELKEIEVNTAGSDFIVKNYATMVTQAMKMGIDPAKANDVVHDVYMSYLKAEANGNGYDMNKGNRDGFITVDQAVYGRLKGYCTNPKYKVATENSSIRNGKEVFKEVACSNSGEDLDTMTSCQKAYSQISSYDDIEAVNEKMSVAEELDFVVSFAKEFKTISIIHMLKELDFLLEKAEDRNYSFDTSLFKDLQKAGAEFLEAFRNIVKLAYQNPTLYKEELNRVLSA